MKLFIGWITAVTVLASPCAWDTSQRELLDRLHQKSALTTLPKYPSTTFQLKEPT